MAAANAALNSFNKVLLANHIKTCVADDIRAGKDETCLLYTSSWPACRHIYAVLDNADITDYDFSGGRYKKLLEKNNYKIKEIRVRSVSYTHLDVYKRQG